MLLRKIRRMSSENLNTPNAIAIIGVGLLGGSIAKAVKQRMPDTTIIGVGRDEDRLGEAQQMGLLDEFGGEMELVEAADIVVVCTPVNRIAIDVKSAAEHARPDAIITDVGSVKGTIVGELRELTSSGRFVGSHPMAGSEKSGFEHADADLFEGANCIVCPTDDTPEVAIATVTRFWEKLGSMVSTMSAVDHDRIVAAVSHLPHAVAAALARTPDADALPFAATGFADTTRIARGNPQMWTAIFEANREEVLKSLDEFKRELDAFRDAMTYDDKIHTYLRDACKAQQKNHV